MQQIFNFILKNSNRLLFLLLLVISFSLTIQSHSYHKSKIISSANFFTGGIYEKINNTGHIDKDRHWWPNVEALVGFLNAYELSGDTAYLNKALASWRFISANLIDKETGEWFWSVNETLQPNRKDDKAGFWKCPYHNGRMCLEVVERIK